MPSKVVDLLNVLPVINVDKNATIDSFHNYINENMVQLSDGMFGVFKGRNDTSEGSFYRINDGENDQSLYLSNIEYNGQTSLPQNWWPEVAPTPAGQALGIKGKSNYSYKVATSTNL